MKKRITGVLLAGIIGLTLFSQVFAQTTKHDSTYLPPISITSANGFGPYVIGAKRSNLFIVVDLPEKTSKITMRMIDVDSNQINNAYIKEGSDLQDAIWSFESDTMGLPLSPALSVVVEYQGDSTAAYKIPYKVYPDTAVFRATAGWGPFITNNYPRSDTSWHDVPEQYNSFAISNLPPRTDSVKFKIMASDSTVIDSSFVHAASGSHLDSASYESVRMDQLPLATSYLEAVIFCNGGPDNGVSFHKPLQIIPQTPRLICVSDEATTIDSISHFRQGQIDGKALLVDSLKYAEILNGPGIRMDEPPHKYQGPYSLDIMDGDFTIEAWLQFDVENLKNNPGEMFIMKVDSVWALSIRHDAQSNWLFFSLYSLAGGEARELFYISPGYGLLNNTEWHHLAYTSSSVSQNFFYFDGQLLGSMSNDANYNHILDSVDYKASWKTKPLLIGGCRAANGKSTDMSYVTAIDEIRIWNRTLTQNEIKSKMHKHILQDTTLIGYWNFNDLRNHLNLITDLSFKNNNGQLKNSASFIPENPDWQRMDFDITVVSSNKLTDSIEYRFYNDGDALIDSVIVAASNAETTLTYNMSDLPFNTSRLRVTEHCPGVNSQGFSTDYPLQGKAPIPIATPLYNWNVFYCSEDSIGHINCPVTVSGLPNGTQKVALGLEKEGSYSGIVSYTENNIPYRYSLRLNGEDNYIESSDKVTSPVMFTINFWFRTTTSKGGKIIGFTDTRNGITNGHADREIIMEKNGSLKFNIRSGSSTHTLYAINRYNDGMWHFVEVDYTAGAAYLSIDGTLVDQKDSFSADIYDGYWIIGRNNANKPGSPGAISEYFEGSLAEIKIYSMAAGGQKQVNLFYNLDEGTGNTVHDTGGDNNGDLYGSSQNWNKFNTLSFVRWQKDMLNVAPGNYTFFANVYYPGAPEGGAHYELGRYIIRDPSPGYFFAYHLSLGIGYFNEGTELNNDFEYFTGYDQSNQPDWKNNFVKFVFLSPEHEIISQGISTYPNTGYNGIMTLDVGEAPTGSYLSIEQGYHTQDNHEHITSTFSIPVYINPMADPKVLGNFGPFDQQIAPGTMLSTTTYQIVTEIASDLKKITAKFCDNEGKEIGSKDAVKVNDTLWTLTYDMGTLSPPFSNMKLEYFLGANNFLALVEGPFKIQIHKTRPKWFDFLPASYFHNVVEAGDSVTFSVVTPFEDNFLINSSETVTIPNWVPLIGGTSSTLESPNAEAYLSYHVPTHTLSFSKPPEFFQKVFNLGAGTADFLRFGFNYAQDNTYSLDEKNDLIASQNFAIGGNATTGFKKLENVAKKVKEIIRAAQVADPESAIISPSFGFTATGSFEYASREHLITDTTTGKWGSFGNLDVNANPAHHQEYINSASYHFYSGSMGIEFSVGAKLLDGLVEGDFGLDGRFLLGFGHSYKTIPKNESKPLHSLAFQTYGRFYITVFWGWIERTVWGPKMFYNKTIWGDDMTNAFPPMKLKNGPSVEIPADSVKSDLLAGIRPVSGYSKMLLPHPQQSVKLRNNNRIYTWLEPGKKLGERKIRARTFNTENGYFSNTFTVTSNRNAPCDPSADMIDDHTILLTWTQSRHLPESIHQKELPALITSFARSQDIWFSVFDLEKQEGVVIDRIDDDFMEPVSGRAEGKPDITILSGNRVLITWQVADLETHESDIWYSFINKTPNGWHASHPAILSQADGLETEVKVESPEENIAVAVWKNTLDPENGTTVLMSSVFNGSYWTGPEMIPPLKSEIYINYFDMDFENDLGGLVWAEYISGKEVNNHEMLQFLPWDPIGNEWSKDGPECLLVDSAAHIQLPRITVCESGTAAITCKMETLGFTDPEARISHVDLFTGKLNNLNAGWERLSASNIVCDTNKQIREMEITFAGRDTLVILSHEFIMAATNMEYEPLNGIRFGDSYMNQVLRSVNINEDGEVQDVNENLLFPEGNDTISPDPGGILGQNYPNPCSSNTTIQIYLPAPGSVQLELLDIKGHIVELLLDMSLPAGPYEVQLNTSGLKQGTYFYRLTSNGGSQTKKMIVGK